MPFLLRIELPDVPGSLGRVAAAIGEAGADIEAIEIVEHRADGTAVDDVLLEMAPTVMPDSIVSVCSALDGVRVLWISRYGAGGNLFLDLEAVETMTEEPLAALDRLIDLVPLTFRADWAVRVRKSEERVVVLHRTSAAPDMDEGVARWLPLERAARLSPEEGWDGFASTVLAAAPLGAPEEIVLLGRRGGPEILESELARLGHLASLAVSIARHG